MHMPHLVRIDKNKFNSSFKYLRQNPTMLINFFELAVISIILKISLNILKRKTAFKKAER